MYRERVEKEPRRFRIRFSRRSQNKVWVCLCLLGTKLLPRPALELDNSDTVLNTDIGVL